MIFRNFFLSFQKEDGGINLIKLIAFAIFIFNLMIFIR